MGQSTDGVLGYGRCPGAPRSSGLGWSVGTRCGGGQHGTWCALCLRLLWFTCLVPNARRELRLEAEAQRTL
jgi:hypothetical protein